jgi:predicted dithiol-disulfide oxidoreductase (DUF899 family)
MSIPHPPITTPEEWLTAQKALLLEEKALTRHADRVSALRRRLPMVRLEKEYQFEGPNGLVKLQDLFEGHPQLIIYHFMFDPEWDDGCMGCTGYVDALGDLSLLAERNTSFALVSRAPFHKLESYRIKRGWNWPWFSSFGSEFNYDFHVTHNESVAPLNYNYVGKEALEARRGVGEVKGEDHGTSVLFLLGDDVYHVYSSFARGTEGTTDSYGLLDRTPYGRQENWEDSPEGWPQRPTYG